MPEAAFTAAGFARCVGALLADFLFHAGQPGARADLGHGRVGQVGHADDAVALLERRCKELARPLVRMAVGARQPDEQRLLALGFGITQNEMRRLVSREPRIE